MHYISEGNKMCVSAFYPHKMTARKGIIEPFMIQAEEVGNTSRM